MNDFINKALLKEGAEKYGVNLDETALSRFDTYAKLLVSWNEKINLTAITQPEEIVAKHFVDSLTVFSFIDVPQGAKVIDVGTGAGFPGVAMLIARPDLQLTLLDSTKKKLGVIEDILGHLEIKANLVHSRAEEAGQKGEYREKFDLATARAVAALRELSEYCLPFVKKGGSFVSMKGARALEEVSEAKKAIAVLGGRVEKEKNFELSGAGERNVIIIKKISQTPTKYPRPAAKIAKQPLK